jgi:DNA-binding beta-propeller fold protein YncE
MHGRRMVRRFRWALLAAGLTTVGILASAQPDGTSRLVSVQKLPENIDECMTWDKPSEADANLMTSSREKDLFSALQEEPAAPTLLAEEQKDQKDAEAEDDGDSKDAKGKSKDKSELPQELRIPQYDKQERDTAEMRAHGARAPLRVIRDTRPAYNSVAINEKTGEVILQDNNLQEFAVFDRLTPTPEKDDELSQPKRLVRGDHTMMEFDNGMYVDPSNGDIYSVQSDAGDRMLRFAGDSNGDANPISWLHTPHRAYNIAADEGKGELFLSVEYPPRIVIYPKGAKEQEQFSREIEGDNTGLDTPHGLAVDEKDRLLFVNTWGHHSNFQVQGTGKFYPPAIKVYPLDGRGDVKPLREISGDSSQLDWPGAMKYNPDNGDLYVANDIGQSVVVFAHVNSDKVKGDVAPVRVIHGPTTQLLNPTGIAIDRKNQEVWVTNLGNSTATVYPLMANGDLAPLRIIRSAPDGNRGPNFGRTNAVGYDTLRQEILVPNCVNHPQIAIFARTATEDSQYLRAIEGQKSLLSRTMHDIAFDAVHDEIVVTGPLTQSILTFRGGANGEEAPLRVIQGDKTLIKGVGAMDKVAIDAVHGEYYITTPEQQVLVFDRMANGNVAPKRILAGSHTQLMLNHQSINESPLAPYAYGGGDGPRVRVDPIHNLLFVPATADFAEGGGGGRNAKMLIFDRTASGDTPPIAYMNTAGGGFEIYPEQSHLITYSRGRNGFEIWKVPARGETTTGPFARIAAPLGRMSSSNLALDPLHRTVMVSTAAGNSVLTFFVPELYDHTGSEVPLASTGTRAGGQE